MSTTCEHADRMSKMIQIRNVPDDLHRQIKAKAALSGMTLSDFLLAELRRLADRPTLQEWLARVATREPVEGIDWAAEVRRDRGEP